MSTNGANGQFFEGYLLANERWLVGTSERNGEHQTNEEISEDEIAAFFCKNNLDDELRDGKGLAGDDFDAWYAANESAINAYYEAQEELELKYGTDEAKEFMLEAMESYLDSVHENQDLNIDITNLADSRVAGTRNSLTRGLADTLGVSATTSLDTYKSLTSNVDFVNDNFQYEAFDTTGLTKNDVNYTKEWNKNKVEYTEYKDNNGNVLKKDYVSYSRGHVEKSEIFDTDGNLLRTEHYDNKGNLSYVEALDENGNTVRYSVDKDGNVEGITVKDSNGDVLETVSAQFENGTLISTSKTNGSDKETTTYKDGKPTVTTYSGSFAGSVTYDSDGEPKEARRKATVDGNAVYEQLDGSGKPTGKYYNIDGSEYIPQAQQPGNGGRSGDPTVPPTGDPTAPPTGDPTAPPTGDPTAPTDPPAGEGDPILAKYPVLTSGNTQKTVTVSNGTRIEERDANGKLVRSIVVDKDGNFLSNQMVFEDGITRNVPENAASTSVTTGANNSKILTTYDSNGNQLSVTQYQGSTLVSNQWYDSTTGKMIEVPYNTTNLVTTTGTFIDGKDGSEVVALDGTGKTLNKTRYDSRGNFLSRTIPGSNGKNYYVPETATSISISDTSTPDYANCKLVTVKDNSGKTVSTITYSSNGSCVGKTITGRDGREYNVTEDTCSVNVQYSSTPGISKIVTTKDYKGNIISTETYNTDGSLQGKSVRGSNGKYYSVDSNVVRVLTRDLGNGIVEVTYYGSNGKSLGTKKLNPDGTEVQ